LILPMIHRSALLACTCALAFAASACDRTPTDPSRPDHYVVTFLGAPADAENFTPRAVSAGRVVGTARAGTDTWGVQWSGGSFSRIGPDAPAGCDSEALGARLAFTVGQVTCGNEAGTPTDAYGWVTGVGALPRLFPEPYGFVDVNRSATIVGTVFPPAQFPQGAQRAFLVQGTAVTILLPPGAVGSVATGISDEGLVAVTAYYDCTGQEDCESSRAMVWNGGAWSEVPLLARTDRSVAAAVSSDGNVTGYALGDADGIFLYDAPEDDDFAALPVVPGTQVEITGANALGQVVGTGFRQFAAPGQQASYGIVWGDNQQFSISERIEDDAPWIVTAALATDDEGRIAGAGFNTVTGEDGAILLVPST
jgi:hypothetical protein